MNTLIFSIGALFVIACLFFSVVTAINTRNKYCDDFAKRKSEREKLRVSR